MKMKLLYGCLAALLLIIGVCAFQTGIPTTAVSYDPTTGKVPMYTTPVQGVPTLMPSKIGDNGSAITYNGSVINSGTVTSFAFTNGGGFTGSVSTATSTPTLSLTYTNVGTVTGTGASNPTATITGVTSSSTCVFTPGNSSAAAFLAVPTAVYITPTTNTVTLNAASVTSGAVFNVRC